ncbi:alpha-ketoglutarate-dependent dioxygenase AlkB family protein [Jannaschia marina]|uniref:alpha-ketoglutarate-dependent dioxygenase AlkB family protein n=1 Tax=Jannaschia marina TaxID=2741674 RepID=UPI0022A75C30|nr:alpha-ketoglutarate-dependent dioxygenase AlkB [Jannaschia marina]
MTETAGRDLRGIRVYDGWLDPARQAAMVGEIRAIARAAPFVQPVTRFGKPLSVRMTSAGTCGWVSDRRGYRYAARHPSGVAWPPIPAGVRAVWDALVPEARAPECCLVNWYGPEARMGMHVDRDEADFDQPVVSISLGDDALFRVGNAERGGRTQSTWLRSGDVLVMGGAARLLAHSKLGCDKSPILLKSKENGHGPHRAGFA